MTSEVKSRGKAVQPHYGRTQANRLGSLPTGISSWINSAEMLNDTYGRLETEEERKAFFDEFLKRQRSGFAEAWLCIYQTVDLIRENDWYWKEAGFESFEAFWQEQGAALFGKWAELENLYHYAKQAAPELFELELNEAKVKAQIDLMRATLSLLLPAGPHGGNRNPEGRNQHSRNGSGQVDSCKLDLDPRQQAALELLGPGGKSAEYQAGWADGRNDKARGGNSLRYRFQRLRRDCPEVADRILAGEAKFFPVDRHGQVRVDLVAAEIEAGIRQEGEKTRQPADPLEQIGKYLPKLDTKQLMKLHALTTQLLESRK
jgi:hypothetical protein